MSGWMKRMWFCTCLLCIIFQRTVPYRSGHNQEEVTSKLSASADQATRWYKSNLLVGNLEKYQTLNIGYRTGKTGSERASGGIRINKEEIKTAETLKLLGVTIDSRLNFSEHVNSACKKASQRIAVLMRLRNLIPFKAKLQLFKAAVLPHLTYCYLIWQFCRASDSRLNGNKKEAWEWCTMKSKLLIFNYWKGPSCQIWSTDVCKTFVFLCIKLNINYGQVIFAIYLKNTTLIIIWANLIFLYS